MTAVSTINHSLSDMQIMAESIARCGLFGMKTPDQALALMLVAQAEGMHPATVTQDYDIIQGKACRKSHSVMARFQQTGGKVEWHELTDRIADATFSHPSGGTLRMNWTWHQAELAKLTNKDNWKNYPRAMLRSRLIAEAIRAVYPAALGGMLMAEEAQDLPMETNAAPEPGSAKAGRNPHAAAAQNAPDELVAFEDSHLQALRDAAMNGSDALQAAFTAIPATKIRTAFWMKHGVTLKAAAAPVNVIDAETGEVTQ